MNVDDLTIGQAKGSAAMFQQVARPVLGEQMLGTEVIVRTFSAGVWFGVLAQKSGSEVILENARRMWRWKCAKSISLSGVVAHGIDRSESRIAPPVQSVWLDAIEIMPIAGTPASSIREADRAEAQ